MRNITLTLILFLLPLLVFSACGDHDEKGIDQVLETRNKAYNERDADIYKQLVYDNYNIVENGEIIDKDELVNRFAANTGAFDSISMKNSERAIEVDGSRANIVQKTSVDLRIENETVSYEFTEVLSLKKAGNEWKISRESKIDLFRAFVFGG